MSEAALAAERQVVVAAVSVEAVASDTTVHAPADCSPAQLVESRYTAALETLLDDALEHRHVEILVDALTFNLARLGYGFGMTAVGDIVRRLGGHINDIAQREAAQREATEAKKAGRMTQ